MKAKAFQDDSFTDIEVWRVRHDLDGETVDSAGLSEPEAGALVESLNSPDPPDWQPDSAATVEVEAQMNDVVPGML